MIGVSSVRPVLGLVKTLGASVVGRGKRLDVS